MKYLVYLLLALCSFAYAGDVTLLVGVSQFTPHETGVWYQEEFPHRLNMRSGSLGLRYDSATGANGLSYSVGYMNLGRVSSSAQAISSDAVYGATHSQCNGSECWPLSTWIGSGDVQGIYGSRVHHIGAWAFEYGLYLYRPTWSVHIPDYYWQIGQPPVDLTVTHNPKWQIGPMLGLRYQVDKWSLNLSTWHTASEGDECASLYTNQTYNLSVGYTF